MLILAAAFGSLIGLVLGALGGGGSILAVPVLVYVLDQEVQSAVLTSLLVVGSASVAGAVAHISSGSLPVPTLLRFAGGGAVGAFLGARTAHLLADEVLLVGFALVMLGASWAMLARNEPPKAGKEEPNGFLAAGVGTVVGVMTGLFGVGGGFLIVPAWTLLLGFEMRVAVSASLVVIVLNSIVAVLGHLGRAEVDVGLAVAFTVTAVIGAVFGERLGRRFSSPKLEKAFGFLVVGVAIYVLVQVFFLGGPVG